MFFPLRCTNYTVTIRIILDYKHYVRLHNQGFCQSPILVQRINPNNSICNTPTIRNINRWTCGNQSHTECFKKPAVYARWMRTENLCPSIMPYSNPNTVTTREFREIHGHEQDTCIRRAQEFQQFDSSSLCWKNSSWPIDFIQLRGCT